MSGSEIFTKLVEVVGRVFSPEMAEEILSAQCRSLGKTPEGLRREDCGLLVVSLMVELSGSVPESKWRELDAELKVLLDDGEQKGKVKGGVLSGVLDYVALKRGKTTLEALKRDMDIKSEFRPETWYPVGILVNILSRIGATPSQYRRSRCHDLGHYIITQSRLGTNVHLFGKRNRDIGESLSNLKELIMLEAFQIRMEGGSASLEFESSYKGYLDDFMMGMCEGLFSLRDARPVALRLMDTDNDVSAILIMLQDSAQEMGVSG